MTLQKPRRQLCQISIFWVPRFPRLSLIPSPYKYGQGSFFSFPFVPLCLIVFLTSPQSSSAAAAMDIRFRTANGCCINLI